jgi:hypothetical protein
MVATTFQPFSANRRAVASPKPLEQPVMSTVRVTSGLLLGASVSFLEQAV